MVNVVYDKRKWRIVIEMDNEECPYLYYPANIHGCKVLGENAECVLENCPYRKREALEE